MGNGSSVRHTIGKSCGRMTHGFTALSLNSEVVICLGKDSQTKLSLTTTYIRQLRASCGTMARVAQRGGASVANRTSDGEGKNCTFIGKLSLTL